LVRPVSNGVSSRLHSHRSSTERSAPWLLNRVVTGVFFGRNCSGERRGK
jgi:hypothetical protein